MPPPSIRAESLGPSASTRWPRSRSRAICRNCWAGTCRPRCYGSTPLSTVFPSTLWRRSAAVVEASPSPNSVLLANGVGDKRLFCICGLDLYQFLADELHSVTTTYGIYVPPEKSLGKFGKELDDRYAYSSVEALAERYAAAVVALDPEGPYHLLGLSFGGVLAYETAQQLIRRGANVPLVALLDSVLPSAIKVRAYRHAIDLIKNGLFGADRRRDAPKASATEKLSHDQMGAYRSHFYWALAKSYEPAPFDGDLLLVRATQSKLFGRGHIYDEQLGWGALAGGRFGAVNIDGTHTGILQPPHVAELATALQETGLNRRAPSFAPLGFSSGKSGAYARCHDGQKRFARRRVGRCAQSGSEQ